MLFNSYPFLFVYLPIAFAGFFLCAKVGIRTAAGWLGLMSVAFYGYWNPAHVPLLLASVVFNYAVGTALAKGAGGPRRAKALLIVGVTVDLAVLCYYKYAGFFVANRTRRYARACRGQDRERGDRSFSARLGMTPSRRKFQNSDHSPAFARLAGPFTTFLPSRAPRSVAGALPIGGFADICGATRFSSARSL